MQCVCHRKDIFGARVPTPTPLLTHRFMWKVAKALPDVDERKTGKEKELPKSHFTGKATLKLKTGVVVEIVLSAGEDLQINEVPNIETQKFSYENTCGKLLHLVEL